MNRKIKITVWLAATGVGLTLGVKYIFPVLAPFCLGLFFAGVIEPLVMWCETRLRLKRAWTVPALLALVMFLVLALVAVTLILTYQEALHLWKLIPGWAERLVEIARRSSNCFQAFFPDWQRWAKLYFNPEFFSQISRPVFSGLISALPRFPQIAVMIFLGMVSAFFFSRDKQFFRSLLAALIPTGFKKPVREFQAEVIRVLSRYFRLECGLVLATMTLTFVCLRCFAINGALAYALLAGFLDLVPVLGPGLIYLPIICSCLVFGNYGGAAGVCLGYFLLLLVRQVAELKICGADLQIHPLLTLVVIYLGMKFFGLMGFIAGPAILMILNSCYRVFLKYEVYQEQVYDEEKNRNFRFDRFDRSPDSGSSPGISGTL